MLGRLALLRLVALALALAASAGASEDRDGGWIAGELVDGEGFTYRLYQKRSGDGHALFRVRGTVRATPDALFEAVRTVTASPERAPEGQTRRVISVDEQSFTVHTHIALPAFFSDRDIVTRGEGSTDAATGRRRIDWEAIEYDAIPPREGTIRISRSAGFWDFAPDGAGASLAVYETYVDLGGSLPRWIVDTLMKGQVVDAFEDVAREALGP